MVTLLTTLLAFVKTGPGKIALIVAGVLLLMVYVRTDARDDIANEIRAKTYREYQEHGRKVDDIIQEVEDADKILLRDLLRDLGGAGGL